MPGNAGAAHSVAIDVPRLPRRTRAVRSVLCRSRWRPVVPQRRHRSPRRRRLPVVRGPRRRRHQDLRPPRRPVRGGERPHGAPGRRRGGRLRRTRRGRRIGDPCGRRAAPWRPCGRRASPLGDSSRPTPAGCGGGATPDHGRRRPAQDPQRQDHAASAAGPRTGVAGRRPVHPRDGRPRHERVRPVANDGADPSVRGAIGAAVRRDQDPRVPPPVRRRGGRRGRRQRRALARRQRGLHLSRARSRDRTRRQHGLRDGRDVRAGRGLQRRARRLDAPVRRRVIGSSVATQSSAVACRSPSAWPSPTTCAASSA